MDFIDFMSKLFKTQFDATQPLRFLLPSTHLIEFIKYMPDLFKMQFETIQPLRFELNRYA